MRQQRISSRSAKRRAEHPEQCAAHTALNNAITAGKLVRQPCQNCPSTKQAQGHHESYEKEFWLDVIWLCKTCHDELHRYKRNEQCDVELALAAW